MALYLVPGGSANATAQPGRRRPRLPAMEVLPCSLAVPGPFPACPPGAAPGL